MNNQPKRLRFAAGAIASVVIAFIVMVWCHEFTHIVQAWYMTGHFHYDMEWNPSFAPQVCNGHLACAGDRPLETSFWTGEGLAYVVTYATFPTAFLILLPKLSGVRFEKRAVNSKAGVLDVALATALTNGFSELTE